MKRRVVAVGLDAAEPSLVARWIADGSMPFLARLRADGAWADVVAPSHVGSGAVWPTFMTGQPASVHQACSEWTWSPERMTLDRSDWSRFTPFWLRLCEEGRRVASIDVPFSTAHPHPNNLQVSDWGAHDWTGQETSFPESVDDLVRQVGEHPFLGALANPNGPDDDQGLRRIATACREGARQRGRLARLLVERFEPDLTIVVFGETHRASHFLWSSVDPSHPRHVPDPEQKLREVFVAVDEEIRLLADAAGADAELVVFSLHGMRGTEGVSTLLDTLLPAAGWAARPAPRIGSRLSPGKLFAAAKRLVPSSLKDLYYKTVPRNVTYRLAQPIMDTDWNWGATRAFPLPSDQHGWIRINLEGREREGIVPRDAYGATCEELRAFLHGLENRDGIPLVERVLLTAEGDPPAHLPDLVVHWNPAAETRNLTVSSPELEAPIMGHNLTGQHRSGGFCIAPPSVSRGNDSIDAATLGTILSGLLEEP